MVTRIEHQLDFGDGIVLQPLKFKVLGMRKVAAGAFTTYSVHIEINPNDPGAAHTLSFDIELPSPGVHTDNVTREQAAKLRADFVFRAMLAALEHELREKLMFRKKPLYNPHPYPEPSNDTGSAPW